ncbi:hypothetical protein [Spirosoma foliorum]|uniref:Uncharacterized protein n=1 Tax=Spirosoma foliorum TaxID=2710596 RepID=A0A7G5H0W4_9BACT|nr:hypothetical protein [Spirosoma foliorum]QMW04756.1 hypothetical protein H3H32_07475 [Spirosoma foliorum]
MLAKVQTVRLNAVSKNALIHESCYDFILMKQLTVFLLLGLIGCHNSQVEPPEVKATILTYEPTGYVCDGGYTIKSETEAIYMARTTNLPTPYNDFNTLKLPVSVWIRYKNPATLVENCGQPPLIQIVSMRAR